MGGEGRVGNVAQSADIHRSIAALTQLARDRHNMAALPNEVDDRPMFIASLQMVKLQIGQFAAPQSAAK
jgi:hypothetical protein